MVELLLYQEGHKIGRTWRKICLCPKPSILHFIDSYQNVDRVEKTSVLFRTW